MSRIQPPGLKIPEDLATIVPAQARSPQSKVLRAVSGIPTGFMATYAALGGSLVLNLIGGVLVARLLGVTGRGQLAFQVQLSAVGVALCSAGLGQAITVGAAAAKGMQAPWPRIAAKATAIAVVIGLLLGTVGIFLTQNHSDSGLDRTGSCAFLSIIASTVVTQSMMGLLRAGGRFLAISLVIVAMPTAYVGLVLVAGGLGRSHPSDFLLCNAIASLSSLAVASAGMLIGTPAGKLFGTTGEERAERQRLTSYVKRSYAGSIASVDTLQLDGLVLGAVAGPRYLGVYSVALALSSLVKFQSTAASLVLLPLFARGGSTQEASASAARAVRALALLTATPLVPIGYVVIPFVYGDGFNPSVLLLTAVLIAAFLGVARNVSADQLRAQDRPGLVSLVELFILSISVPLFVLSSQKNVETLGAAAAAVQGLHLTTLEICRRRTDLSFSKKVS